MNIRCMIVDDEPLALDVLETYLRRIDYLQLVARMENAVEAFQYLSREPVDLLFLDIQMPGLTGLELLRNLHRPPKVILTTAYRDYALAGYDLDAIDYLLKPVSFERFLKAVSKFTQMTTPNHPSLIGPSESEDPGYEEAFIYLKADKKMVKILLRDIFYIESLKDYVRVKAADKSVTAYQRISFLEEKLPEDRFLRIHRSFIVATDKVQAFSNTMIEVGGTELPIGRNYRVEVLNALNEKNLLRE